MYQTPKLNIVWLTQCWRKRNKKTSSFCLLWTLSSRFRETLILWISSTPAVENRPRAFQIALQIFVKGRLGRASHHGSRVHVPHQEVENLPSLAVTDSNICYLWLNNSQLCFLSLLKAIQKSALFALPFGCYSPWLEHTNQVHVLLALPGKSLLHDVADSKAEQVYEQVVNMEEWQCICYPSEEFAVTIQLCMCEEKPSPWDAWVLHLRSEVYFKVC